MNSGRFKNNKNKVSNLDSNNINFNSMRPLSPIRKKPNDASINYESKISNTDINLINSDNYNFRQFSRNPNLQKLNQNANYNLDYKNKKLKPFSNNMINLILFLKTSYNNNANIAPLNILSKLKEFDNVNQSQNNTMNNMPKNYIDNDNNNNNNYNNNYNYNGNDNNNNYYHNKNFNNGNNNDINNENSNNKYNNDFNNNSNNYNNNYKNKSNYNSNNYNNNYNNNNNNYNNFDNNYNDASFQ